MNCLHCTAETSNGLALCETCRAAASVYLEWLPVYFRNLARWTPGRAGARPVPGSRVLYDGDHDRTGTGDRISDALDETANMLTTWARALVNDRPHLARLLDRLAAARTAETITEAQSVAWLCKGFERYLTSISTVDWCGEFVRDLSHHETRLSALTETFVPGWYAGGCQQLVGFDDEGSAVRCMTSTYVVPGLSWVTCGGCGATTYARDHLENVLTEARDWVARPMRLAEAAVALLDTEQSVPRLHKRISKWGERGQIEVIRYQTRGYMWDEATKRIVVVDEETGYARYRLGEVMDRLLTDGATRTNDTVAAAAS